MFNPNVIACLRVFHLMLEHVFLAQRHCDCRGAEFAVECHLLDQSLDGVADSPAAGIAGRVAAGALWPGRTEILKFRRWVWVCHLGLLSGAHRIAHRKRGPGHAERKWTIGPEGGCWVWGPQLARPQPPRKPEFAWKYRACAGHAHLLFRDGLNRQAAEMRLPTKVYVKD